MQNSIYYVYILLDPTKPGEFKYKSRNFPFKPFYVGKGKNDRAYSHGFAGLKRMLSGTQGTSRKELTVDRALRNGLEPPVVLYKKNLTEAAAVELELLLITDLKEKFTLSNVMTATWESHKKKIAWSAGRKVPATNSGAGTEKHYDPKNKVHVFLNHDQAKLIASITQNSLIPCGGLARKNARSEKSVDPSKSRPGSANGRFGMVSSSKGKKWYTVDGKESLLSLQEARVLKDTSKTFAVGRTLFMKKAKSLKSTRALGRRIIFEGELSGKYRVFEDVQGKNVKKKYQIGWVWSPGKPTYRNGKLL